MDRETEMSAVFVSFTPVLDAPASWEQRPFGSAGEVSTVVILGQCIWNRNKIFPDRNEW